jgi:hypothetical protein
LSTIGYGWFATPMKAHGLIYSNRLSVLALART